MPRRRKRHHTKLNIALVTAVAALIIAAVLLYLRPLPALYPVNNVRTLTVTVPLLSWPNSQQAAIGGLGYGVLDTNGTQTEQPIASTAKLITALTVLNHDPLSLGQQGPMITFSDNDVAIYNNYLAEDGSVVKVVSGEQMSEYQALSAMLLPSANNVADSLAIWAFGSLQNYLTAASQEIQGLGLSSTVVSSDASGFNPATVSTAHDLVLLGENAMQNPVIAQIVGQSEANLPVVGEVKNVNTLLGQNGIVGIKTGNTDQAGGVYIFAAKDSLNQTYSVTIVGAIQGSPTLQDALGGTIPLLISAESNFRISTVVGGGQPVGYYKIPWSKPVSIIASQNLTGLLWTGQAITPAASDHAIYGPQLNRAVVGFLSLPGSGNHSVSLILSQKITAPPWWWRIFHT
ncbi:MAG TPA: hypothetical protein VMR08_01395 [Patescibacteria group bacterium]|nr:hypothetical protein [Patescibacteria group bacterium]